MGKPSSHLSASALSALQQLPRVVVPREPRHRPAAAPVALHSLSPKLAVLGGGLSHPDRLRLPLAAALARGAVHPREELRLEPAHQGAEERHVPFGLGGEDRVGDHAEGTSLS